MKILVTLAALAAFAGNGFAQLNPLPPSSSTVGIDRTAIGANAGVTHWDNPSTLGAFKGVATTEGMAPITSLIYNPINLPFATAMPGGVQTSLSAVASGGGSIRAIFLSESAGWRDSFGFTYSGDPSGPQSYTAFANMEDFAAPTISFGTYIDVPFAQNELGSFDFWANGTGEFGGTNIGGAYTLFNPSNSEPYSGGSNFMWSQQSLQVNTWVDALGAYANVTTWVVGFEDWRLDRGSDRDYSDAIFAFQVYDANGLPFTPIPEPSTYTLIGAAALLGLAAFRRFKRKSAQVSNPTGFAC